MRRARIILLAFAALSVAACAARGYKAVDERSDAPSNARIDERETPEPLAPQLPRALEELARANAPAEPTDAATIDPRPTFFSEFYADPVAAPSNEPIDSDSFPLADDSANDPNEFPVWSRWAKFPIGTWARRRTTSVSYENHKPVQSVTETRALLKSVDFEKRQYVLQYDSSIKMGSVDFARKSETVRYDFWDVPVDDTTKEEELAPVNLTIGAKTIPCLTRRVSRETGRTRETTVLWYSPTAAPYVLQRETTRKPTSSDAGAEQSSRELYVVQKTGARSLFDVAPQNSIARSTSASGQREQSTTSVLSSTIPGGVIRETTVETRSPDDPTVYQTTTVLLDYYVARR